MIQVSRSVFFRLIREAAYDQLRMPRHQHGGGTGDMRSRHRGTIHPLAASRSDRGRDFFTRRQNVWLAPPVTSRTTRGEIAHAVEMWVAAMRRTDRDNVFSVSRISDADGAITGAQALLFRAAFKAGVTCGNHDHGARAAQMVTRLTNRRLPACKAVYVVRQGKRQIHTMHD
jgi:hypothetical protein